jgi:hypothetical protein
MGKRTERTKPDSMAGEVVADMDRMAADVFGKSYREYLELKPTHFKWSRLAPQSVEWLREAYEGLWSVEKVADYLNCEVGEAEECRRRYAMTRKVNAGDGAGEAERLRRALGEWIGMQPGMEELGEAEKRRRAGELALMVANHLFAAGKAGDDIMKLSRELEGAPVEEPRRPSSSPEGPPKWGPQWKD